LEECRSEVQEYVGANRCVAGSYFSNPPANETCYIWNQDVDLFLRKGAVRGIAVIRDKAIIGYKRAVGVRPQETPERTVVELEPTPNRISTPVPQPTAAPSQPASPSPNLSERQSIESVCSTAKYLQGPSAYDQCVMRQLQELAVGPRQPDLSRLNYSEKQSIESACSTAKHLQGPSAYNQCLIRQLQDWAAGPRHPDLSGLNYSEKQSIESACSTAKYLQGPSAYNQCLVRQLQSLKNYQQ
jgi:hypothetical protein